MKAKRQVFSRSMNDSSLGTHVISRLLIDWYKANKRELPWRTEVSAYRTWLSEIILQQTRVEQGLPYFGRFIEAFPTIEDLATAPEDRVLKLWQGLGYYSRARNLHKAAKMVVDTYGGQFPSSYEEIIGLPGVGPYTAAAIASIVFGEEKAVVDGNVIRVISRVFGITEPVDQTATRKQIEALSALLIAGQDPSDFNQGIMEFGALQCTPKQADCSSCPIQNHCWAYANDAVYDIPLKSKKVKRRSRYLHFIVANDGKNFLLEQRGDDDIWRGLYQFPLIETDGDVELAIDEVFSSLKLDGKVLRVNKSSKHVLSHQDLFARFYHVESGALTAEKYLLVSGAELHTFALPRLIDRYLENYDLRTGKKRH